MSRCNNDEEGLEEVWLRGGGEPALWLVEEGHQLPQQLQQDDAHPARPPRLSSHPGGRLPGKR